ncbi:hypothetical protein T440DRAFT_511810 [Plenodomus tracheiphilus IPT5]|uniref:N-acetyltransferase domain-containing protein n=1 Tax=Plenodomus tracheiphilus IPT5 TaxID=1408161 RepID=A0A6A7APC1_9PLEO|nr:hypothetical protein T440DRAFT_511810 [Plenodomus tracheiphilus IPT5]
MKLNRNTAILTPLTLLVPYSPHHVPTYHTWMQSPSLQQLTASEPLTLEEEYAMQRSWRSDGDKLTFIICTRERGRGSAFEGREKEIETEVEEEEDDVIIQGKQDSPETMIGDVNLFLVEEDDDDGDNNNDQETEQPTTPTPRKIIGEVEIMIASPTHRGRGLARNALLAFLAYIHTSLPEILQEYKQHSTLSNPSSNELQHQESGEQARLTLSYLRVKINKDNEASIRLFRGVGFSMVRDGVPNYFGEVEMRLCGGELGGLADGDGDGGREKGKEGRGRRVVYEEVEGI